MKNFKKKCLSILCAGCMMGGFGSSQRKAECVDNKAAIAAGVLVGGLVVTSLVLAALLPNTPSKGLDRLVDLIGYPEGEYQDAYGNWWWWDGSRYTHWWNGFRWVAY